MTQGSKFIPGFKASPAKSFLLLSLLVFLFAPGARAAYSIFDVYSNDDNSASAGDLGTAVAGTNSSPAGVILFDLPSSPIVLGSVGGGLGSLVFTAPVTLSWDSGAQPLLTGTTGTSGSNVNGGAGGNAVFTSTSNLSLDSSGITLGLWGGDGGSPNVTTLCTSLTAGQGGNAALTATTVVLSAFSNFSSFNFVQGEINVMGGTGGDLSVSGPNGLTGTATAGNGGSAAVSTGTLALGFGAVNIVAGNGGGVGLLDPNDLGIGGDADGGNGGTAYAAVSLLNKEGFFNVTGGNGGSVTVQDLSGVLGNTTAGTGGTADLLSSSVSLSGSQFDEKGGSGGGILVNSDQGAEDLFQSADAGSGADADASIGSLGLKGTAFSISGGDGGGITVNCTNLSLAIFGASSSGIGGNANLSMGPVSMFGSAFNLLGGNGGGMVADVESGAQGTNAGTATGLGGNANLLMGPMTATGSTFNVAGGNGGGATIEASGDSTLLGATGIYGSMPVGAGGTAGVSMGSLSLLGSAFDVTGGASGDVLLNSQFSSDGILGNVPIHLGGAAGVTMGTASLSSSSVSLSGGRGGNITMDADSGGWGIQGNGFAGSGGAITLSMTDLEMDSASGFTVSGGNGGNITALSTDEGFYYGISNGIHGNGAAGAGGLAQMSMGAVSVTGSQFALTGGNGGAIDVAALGGDYGVNGSVTAGLGGNAGLSLDLAYLTTSGFTVSGGNGGSLSVTASNGTTVYGAASAGFNGNSLAGSGGAAAVTGTFVSLTGSNFTVSGGNGGVLTMDTDTFTTGINGNGTAGNGGNAGVSLTALILDSASTFTVSGGTGGVLSATGNGTAISGTYTAGTAGQALVTLGSLNGSGVVSVGGTNAQLQVGTGNFGGVMEGNMNLDLSGGGNLTLTGENLYSGGTSINGSVLEAANSGALGTGNVFNGGTLVYSGPMTLNIGGNYTQSAGATLQLGLGPSSSQWDKLNIAGTASLDGALKVVSYAGFTIHDNETFTLLTAGSVTGTFASIDNTVGGSAVSLVYQSTDVLLTDLANPGSSLTFAEIGTTPNQKNLGAGLDNLAGVLNPPALIAYLNGQTNASLPGIYDQLSPASLTPLFHMGFGAAQGEAGLINRHLDSLFGEFTSRDTAWNGEGTRFAGNLSASDEAGMAKDLQPNQWGVFTDETANFGTVSPDGNGPGYQYFTGGMLAGLDYRFSKDWAAGLFFGYSQSGTSQSTGTVSATGGQEGFFAGMREDEFHVNALAVGGLSNYSTSRNGWSGIATGTTQGQMISGSLSAGYDFKMDQVKIGPYASGQFTSVHINAFSETGSLAPLSYDAQGEDSLDSDLGVASSWTWDLNGISLSPSINAAWEHVYSGNLDALSASFGSGANFTVNGPATGTEAVLVGAGLKAQLSRSFNMYASYQGKIGQTNVTEQNVNAGISLGF